jgi:hypothetical protein
MAMRAATAAKNQSGGAASRQLPIKSVSPQ